MKEREFHFRRLEELYLPGCADKLKRLGKRKWDTVVIDVESPEFLKIDRECRRSGTGPPATTAPAIVTPDRAEELFRRLSICRGCEDYLGMKSASIIKCDRVTEECRCKNLVTGMCPEWEKA